VPKFGLLGDVPLEVPFFSPFLFVHVCSSLHYVVHVSHMICGDDTSPLVFCFASSSLEKGAPKCQNFEAFFFLFKMFFCLNLFFDLIHLFQWFIYPFDLGSH
jgi:hypothetical protein